MVLLPAMVSEALVRPVTAFEKAATTVRTSEPEVSEAAPPTKLGPAEYTWR